MAKKRVPFVDFSKKYKSIEKEIDAAAKRVFKSGRYVLGTEVESFEKQLAKFIGVKYAVGVASGTDALTIAIKSLGLKKGDGVIIPSNVYPTVFGVSLSGVDIQLADVNPETLNLSVDTIKKAVTKKTRAIVVVHLYGNPVNIVEIKKFAKEKKLYLIEDCAQSAGSTFKGKMTGSFGDISCFSFYPTKNLGAFGDGGAIATNSKALFEKIKLWRMYGERKRYDSVLVGQNSRLDELQAALLRVKLKYLNKWNKKRNKIAMEYKKGLEGLPLSFVKVIENAKSNYHLFVIKTKKRDMLMGYLKKNGIDSGIHYPIPIHLTKSFKYLRYKRGDFPVSEKSSREIVSLPIYVEMSDSQVKYVIDVVKKFYKNK